MLDLNYVRENLEAVRAALVARGFPTTELDVFQLIDVERRKLIGELDQLNAQRNAASHKIGQVIKEGKGTKAVRLRAEVNKQQRCPRNLTQGSTGRNVDLRFEHS